jgi:hypothetical protein
MSVTTDFPEVERQLYKLREELQRTVMARTLNDTVAQAKTQMVRGITREYVVTASYVRDRLRIKRAFARGTFALEAQLSGSAKGRSANVIAFLEKSVTLAEGRRRAKAGTSHRLYVQIRRTGGRKALPERSFIGNKGRTVFQREGRARLPIRALQTVDVPQMFTTGRINRAVMDAIRDRLPRIFARHMRFALSKTTGGR